jgi:hypothetical protein
MKRRIGIACFALLVAGLTRPVRADLTIYVQDTNVAQGGYALVNIYLAGQSTDTFNNYSVELDIAPKAGTTGTLVFAANDPNGPGSATSTEQPYSYLYPTTAANYIFGINGNDSVDSLSGSNGGNPVGASPGPYFSVGDQSLNSLVTPTTYAPLSNNPGDTLLASLRIWAESTAVNDQYSMTVNVGNSVFNTYDPSSGMYGNPLTPSLDDATGYTGTITVVAAAVPEPSSIATGLTAVLLMAAWQGTRRLRRRS